jgi:hypothetical protein
MTPLAEIVAALSAERQTDVNAKVVERVARALMGAVARMPGDSSGIAYPILDLDPDFDDLPFNHTEGTEDDGITQEAVLILAQTAIEAFLDYLADTDLVVKVARAICVVQFCSEPDFGLDRCCQVGGTSGCCAPEFHAAARAAILTISNELLSVTKDNGSLEIL